VWGIEIQHQTDAQTVRADISDFRQIRAALTRINPEMVFHLAAEFGRMNGEDHFEQVWRTNAIGTRNILEVQKELGFKHIFASSSEVYGEAGVDWIDEGLLERNAQPRLTNDYAISKRVNEMQIQNFADRYGTQTMVLRFFNAYGPGERYHAYRSVVCLFAYRLLTGQPITVYDGYQRVFMYVGDFIPTLANAVDQFTPGEVVNVGGDEFVDVADMAAQLVEITGADPALVTHLPYDAHNVTSKRPEIAKAATLFSHKPMTTLAEGLPLTVDWLRKTYQIGG
jgi:dTDP-glucose 4,6-dehydratase